jgi:hypothetical protein
MQDQVKATGLNFNLLLASHSIEPGEVMVMRHRPFEQELQKVLPWLAAERPDVFNAYQQAQGLKVENALCGAKFLASFIGHEPGKAVFVGLYSVCGNRSISLQEFWTHPANQYLKTLGMKGFTGEDGRTSILWFDLQLTNRISEWKGKLVVNWPGLERSWWRWADRNVFRVRAILEESLFDKAMPAWEQLALTWHELSALPLAWRAALTQWRGVYYIYDTSVRKGYVGSACGPENLLGRWLNYAATGHGGNKLLRDLKPEALVFTILERMSPDMPAEDVVHKENTWKQRLHSRTPCGLNLN